MDTGKTPEEEFSEWQQIQYSSPSIRIDTIATDDSSELPPCHQESSPSSSEPSSPSNDDVSAATQDSSPPPFRGPIYDGKQNLLRGFTVRLVVKKTWGYILTRGRAFRSFSPIDGLLAALLVSLVVVRVKTWCRRVHEEKMNRLLLLVKEKDQKIRQLVLQMERLNELLSSRRRVPVVRTV